MQWDQSDPYLKTIIQFLTLLIRNSRQIFRLNVCPLQMYKACEDQLMALRC